MEMNKDGQAVVKVSVIVEEGYGQRIGILLFVTSTTRVYNGRGVHLKTNCEGFPMFFVIPCVGEPISVAIPFDHL
jgi:hypothetical protein